LCVFSITDKKRAAPLPRHHGYSDDGYGDDGYGDDQYYSDDDYAYSDDKYYGNHGKGGAKGSKSSKGKGKGKGGGYYPEDDIPYIDDEYIDDEFFHDGNCQLVTFNETFAIPGPSLFLAPDTTVDDPGTPDLPGTVFIFEVANILELDGATPIDGTTVSGSCTRTTIGTDGGGTCDLIFIDEEGYTINVNGFLQGPLGSQLAITGGTGGMVGVIGEMDFFPVYETDSPGDLFLDAVRYEVIADLGIIVCQT
jgi:hypothetical protein